MRNPAECLYDHCVLYKDGPTLHLILGSATHNKEQARLSSLGSSHAGPTCSSTRLRLQ